MCGTEEGVDVVGEGPRLARRAFDLAGPAQPISRTDLDLTPGRRADRRQPDLEDGPTRFDAVKKLSGEPVPPPIPEDERVVVRKKPAKRESSNA